MFPDLNNIIDSLPKMSAFFTLKSKSKDTENKITLKINPISWTESVSISYGSDVEGTPNKDANGNLIPPKKEPAYKKHNFGNLSFKIILYDKLGLSYNDKSIDDVETQIRKLKDTIYHYVQDDHSQPCVEILWGTKLYENCYISDMGINYTLFNKSGKALRAEIDLKFIIGLDKKTEDNMKQQKSPDMSRIRRLNDEDKLSLMCAEFYGDSSKQLLVAKENGIINFRKIKAGTEVYFPPIKK
ncbi:MAG: hypothetical protein MUC49_13590 [Raineya sp.]|jgi:hypothetical protein|nr:hypothetical protein [Raineya sp.]